MENIETERESIRRRPSGNITKPDEDWFCFAGLWRLMPEGRVAFTLLEQFPIRLHNRRS